MRTKFKLLTWDIEKERIFSRNCRNENEAIEAAEALSRRKNNTHDVLTIMRTKKTGHRWNLKIWDSEKPQKKEYIPFYSKKDAIFAIKVIKEYNDTLKINLTKIY